MFVCSVFYKSVMKQVQSFFANIQEYLQHIVKLRLFRMSMLNAGHISVMFYIIHSPDFLA